MSTPRRFQQVDVFTTRALQGNASNAQALETGKRTRPLAEQAWALVQQG
jgi:hypothetical protein